VEAEAGFFRRRTTHRWSGLFARGGRADARPSIVSCGVRFQLEQRFLSFHTPAVAALMSALRDYAMAGNGDCYGVGGAGSRDSSRGFGLPNRLRDGCVGTRCPEGDGLEMRPHAPLKGRCLNIQWQSGIQALAAHLAE